MCGYPVLIFGNIKEKLKLTLWQRLLEDNSFTYRNIRLRIFMAYLSFDEYVTNNFMFVNTLVYLHSLRICSKIYIVADSHFNWSDNSHGHLFSKLKLKQIHLICAMCLPVLLCEWHVLKIAAYAGELIMTVLYWGSVGRISKGWTGIISYWLPFGRTMENIFKAVHTVINITGNRTWPVINLCNNHRVIVNYACNLPVLVPSVLTSVPCTSCIGCAYISLLWGECIMSSTAVWLNMTALVLKWWWTEPSAIMNIIAYRHI
jgi:hypothetical protein